MRTWEDYITLHSNDEISGDTLPPAINHLDTDERVGWWGDLEYRGALEKDLYPIPLTKDREGYYGDNHFSYWASGLRDANLIIEFSSNLGVDIHSYFDIGCASGRVIRHFGVQFPEIKVYGCDINRLHVEWCNIYLPDNCIVFHSNSVPSLPLPDNSIDFISAFSVFTHIESMETAWLMEIRRILRPGGLAWITVHTEDTLKEMDETWPLWRPVMSHPQKNELFDESREFSGNRLVMRWKGDASYSSNVFYRQNYIRKAWGRIMKIVDVKRRYPNYQDVVLFQK